MSNPTPTIYLLGHAHIDLAYRWRWNETVHRVARDTFRGVLAVMDRDPELIFVQSQLALYEAMQQHYPEIFAQIERRVAEGRWCVVDGWCEYDHTMPGGEAIIRQHLIAGRYARAELGCRIDIAWAPDAFSGHGATLPTILKGCGIDCMLFGRGMPKGMPVFHWEGADGSRVLAYSPTPGYSAAISPFLVEQLQQWRETTGRAEMLVLYGAGDHGGGPRQGDLQALAEMRRDPANPRLEHITPGRFFRQVLPSWPGLPVHRGELGGGFTGSCSSGGRNKQQNRRAESLVLATERFATMAVFCQRKPCYPRVDLLEGWKAILHHQFHDELPGTSRGPVFDDNAADYARLTASLTGVRDTALAEIGARVDTRGPGEPVLVFNPLAWERSEPVQVRLRLPARPANVVMCDPDGHALPTQVLSCVPTGHFWQAEVLFLARGVPQLGYRLFRACDAVEPGTDEPLGIGGTALENRFLRATIDARTGQVASLYDKTAGREALAGPAGLQTIAERPGAHSAWIIALDGEAEALAAPDSIEVVETGPVRATVRAGYRCRDSYLVQEYSLYAGRPWLEVRTLAEWYERERCLKVAFPTAVTGGAATFEAPFGHIVRPADGAEVPAQNWIDLSAPAWGVCLLNDCRYGFDVRGATLRMTLLRGIPDLDPRGDEGEHDLRYALYPHAGDWREGEAVRRGWELNMPLLARQEPRHSGMLRPWGNAVPYEALPETFSFVRVEPANVVLSALKIEEEDWGEGSPLVVRVYETAGRATTAELRFAAPLAWCEETNHVEEPIEASGLRWEGGDTVRIEIGPYQIRTLRLSLAVQSLGRDENAPGDPSYLGDPPMRD